ncbi:MAG: transposase [Archaeoglobus sp.]|nr:transposase [Archaeoglobus sp.]
MRREILKETAWKEIIRHYEIFRSSEGVIYRTQKEALASYCEKYNRRMIPISERIYEIVNKISVATFYRQRDRILQREASNELIKEVDIEGFYIPFRTELDYDQIKFILRNYLHKGKVKIKTIYEYMKSIGLDNGVSYSAVYRFLKKFEKYNRADVVYARGGEKKYLDEVGSYIVRDWESVDPDYIWIADGHKLDCMVLSPTGKFISRPVVIMFMDGRSRKIVGVSLHWTETTESVLQALAFGLAFNGTPKYVLFDNGKSFKNARMLGEKIDDVYIKGVLERFGIQPIFSIPGNPRSKPVERMFGVVKDQFSRVLPAFTGGSVAEKPRYKNGEKIDYINIYDLYVLLIKYIHFYNTVRVHSSIGTTPDVIYSMGNKKTWKIDDLKIMMRRVVYKGIGRNGIELEVGGRKRFYYNPDWVPRLAGNKEKYIIYYHDFNVQSVDVHDKHDRYLFTAHLMQELKPVGADKEAISALMRNTRHGLKAARERVGSIQDSGAVTIKEILENIEVKDLGNMEKHNWEIDEDKTGTYLPDEHDDFYVDEEIQAGQKILFGGGK